MTTIKRYLFPATIIVAILGTTFSIYQFYFKSRLTEYNRNLDRKEKLVTRLKDLEDRFDKSIPEEMVKLKKAQVGPYIEAVERRARFFTMPEIEETPIPEKGIFKFIYDEIYNEKFQELSEYAYTRNPPVAIPPVTFGAPDPQGLTVVKRGEVVRWSRDIDYGKHLMKRFIKAGAVQIDSFEIWPRRVQGGLLEMNSLGISFTMTFGNFVNFMETLRAEDRFITVEALKIQNTSLRTAFEPYLQIQMILTQARYLTGADGPIATAGLALGDQSVKDIFSTLRLGGSSRLSEAYAAEQRGGPGFFGKAWRWFKRNILYVSG